MHGKKVWLIADGFMSDSKTEKYVSHEAVCILNISNTDAVINITVYFEDKEPLRGFTSHCLSERTNHIRLDKIKNDDGIGIPREVPYAILIESSVPVICQHSRMDVSDEKMTLMTTMAY